MSGTGISSLMPSLGFDGTFMVDITEFQTDMKLYPRIRVMPSSCEAIISAKNAYYEQLSVDGITTSVFEPVSMGVQCTLYVDITEFQTSKVDTIIMDIAEFQTSLEPYSHMGVMLSSLDPIISAMKADFEQISVDEITIYVDIAEFQTNKLDALIVDIAKFQTSLGPYPRDYLMLSSLEPIIFAKKADFEQLSVDEITISVDIAEFQTNKLDALIVDIIEFPTKLVPEPCIPLTIPSYAPIVPEAKASHEQVSVAACHLMSRGAVVPKM